MTRRAKRSSVRRASGVLTRPDYTPARRRYGRASMIPRARVIPSASDGHAFAAEPPGPDARAARQRAPPRADVLRPPGGRRGRRVARRPRAPPLAPPRPRAAPPVDARGRAGARGPRRRARAGAPGTADLRGRLPGRDGGPGARSEEAPAEPT